jgi:hypothetical protein
MKNLNVRKSYTFTKRELVNAVKAVVSGICEDIINDYLNGTVDKNCYESFWNLDNVVNCIDINDPKLDTVVNLWCDLCSDKFFDRNKDITDVLLMVDDSDKNCPIKLWLASR